MRLSLRGEGGSNLYGINAANHGQVTHTKSRIRVFFPPKRKFLKTWESLRVGRLWFGRAMPEGLTPPPRKKGRGHDCASPCAFGLAIFPGMTLP
jgi:hypothetical protein